MAPNIKQSPLIYIILVNYRNWADTIECLESIEVNAYQNFRVIVVDVADLDNSAARLSEWIDEPGHTKYSLIRQTENKGYSAANNVAITSIIDDENCSFIWVLNNDTVIADNALQELLDFYYKNENTASIGFVGSKILDYKNRDVIQTVGGTFNPWTGYSILTGMGQKDTGQFDNRNYKNDYVIGASMFFHKSLIGKIGLLPEEYFLYYEDIDWCISAKKAGFGNLVCTSSIVYHKQGQSTGSKLLSADASLVNKKYLYSSYLKFYKKHFRSLLPIGYLILLKQAAGKVYRKKMPEAKLIFRTVFF